MLKVMLVDDEPFILEGLSVLIDWQEQGCQIVKKASNGKEAYDYLTENEVDMVFADIKMPVMTGIELMQAVREEGISDAYFVIVSGYNDFHYAQAALRYDALEYLLKPVGAEGILSVIDKVKNKIQTDVETVVNDYDVRKAYLTQNIMLLLAGRHKDKHTDYVKKNLHRYGDGDFRFVNICFGDIDALEEKSDDEVLAIKNNLYEKLKSVLGDNSDRLFADIPGYTDEYELSFIYSDDLGSEYDSDVNKYIERLSEAIKEPADEGNVVFLVGKRVEDLTRLSRSYSSAATLRPYRSFEAKKNIYIYEDDVQAADVSVPLCKEELDGLISGIELNDADKINKSVDALFDKVTGTDGISDRALSINTNYLLFRLLHLAVELDESINQEEVMLYVSDNALIKGSDRGSSLHLKQFGYEYAEYITSLRKNASKGIFHEIEKELAQNYAQNITLRDLSAKYYVNSSYLGQLFKKRYGISFKDYLSNIRIDEAASMLLKTDKKVTEIAEEVGYHDTDYFINRFIAIKGCTPSKYRKNENGTNH
ncbi:MAG: response regulator [Lachnospiraceae bacterium]|nr:response regulator [Lachnospiraceae bacterium]